MSSGWPEGSLHSTMQRRRRVTEEELVERSSMSTDNEPIV